MALERMTAYLSALPRGLDSYPDVMQRGSVLRAMFGDTDLALYRDRLPAELACWVDTPPPAGDWLPEVRCHALTLAIADLCFSSDSAFDDFIYRANRKLLDGPVYSILFRLLGTRRVCAGAAQRWDQMHRNTTLTMHDYAVTSCRLTITAPENHVPMLVARHYASAFKAALELSGAKAVTVKPRLVGGSVVEYSGMWTD